jgi:23S rRNA pseudouridine1911/1915/1917 synthase
MGGRINNSISKTNNNILNILIQPAKPIFILLNLKISDRIKRKWKTGMESSNLKIIYEDDNLLAIDKPAGIVVFPEGKILEKTLIDCILKKYPCLKSVGKTPRYGIVHRLDKNTSGIVLTAKDNETLIFLQKQFKNRNVEKKYLALVVGSLQKENGVIKTLIGRAPKERKKQKVYLSNEPKIKGKREAITEYKTIKKFKNYTLLEVFPKTGRKHQIRCHLAYLGHPIAGDKIYGFKNQPCPKGLKRQFLHASYLKIKLPGSEIKELHSQLPEDLREALENIN